MVLIIRRTIFGFKIRNFEEIIGFLLAIIFAWTSHCGERGIMKVVLALLSLSLVSCTFKPMAAKSEATTAENQEAQLRARLLATKECRGCDLFRAELAGTDLSGANLENANLKGADLNKVNLEKAVLKGAVLRRADLSSGSNLRGADLSGADLTEANLKDADLTGAILCGATMPDGAKNAPCG